MKLHELSVKFNSDKCAHGYTHIYDDKFYFIKNNIDSLVEIGVQYGNSMRMWREYFSAAKIVGLDIHGDALTSIIPTDNFKVIISPAHLIETKFLLEAEFSKGIDIIIDDGSHIPAEQIETFKNLFPLLKHGGLYIIEDIYPAYFGDDFMKFLKQKIDNIWYWDVKSNVGYGFADDANYWDRNILSMEFRRMICIITKGDNVHSTC